MEDRIKRYFENPRKIREVKPLENYVLLLTFDNGEVKKYDISLRKPKIRNNAALIWKIAQDERRAVIA